MGLGTKIKEALHGDHHDTKTDSKYASNQTQMPGTFDNGDLPQRHSDGKPYTAPHGTLIDQEDTTGTGTGTALTRSDKHHNKRAQDINEQWEATSDNRDSFKAGHTRDSGVGIPDPANTSAREPARDSATQGHTAESAGYWGDLPPSHHNTTTSKDLPDRSAKHGRDNQYDNRFADQAVGGGVYNPEASTRIPERAGSRGAHADPTGLTNDPLSSGSRDKAFSHSGRNDNLQGLEGGHRGDDLRTSGRNDLTASGYRGDDLQSSGRNEDLHASSHNNHSGLKGAGAATGAAGAAGYAAHEFSHRDQRHNNSNNFNNNNAEGYNQGSLSGEPAPGMPRSSMLDPEPAHQGFSGPPRQHQAGEENFPSSGGYNSSSSPIDSHNNSNSNNFNKSNSPTSGSGSASGGPGSSARHFGPGHEASKVMHTCDHCGRDNDISKYFSKDVVYRLGQ
ncbi:hypothetical protein BD289DRAFT_449113 [Coniella lustricola]|uniref:Uncharacterized protein n=1 Tax=Coniella lustricola TaxID=2025994 RepID=A0A2T3ANQ6_9PEZI|nr:hypothetical protein BD289DRAFT_449113 [Coniella lustricola]